MHKVFVVAKREYQAAVKTKSFLISLFLMPLLMGGGAIAQYLLRGQVDIKEKRFAIVDRSEGQRLVAVLEAAAKKRNADAVFDRETGKQTKPAFEIEHVTPSDLTAEAIDQQRFELSERVRQGEIFGFVDIGSKVYEAVAVPQRSTGPKEAPATAAGENQLDAFVVRYQSNSPTYDDFRNWARPILESAVQDTRFERSGLDEGKVRSIVQPVPLVVKGLSEKDATTGAVQEAKDENEAASILVPAALMVLMFMLIMVAGTPAMQGVVEEKMQRIAEMVLGSIRPFELMMGKLLGLMGVSLTLAALYLGGAYWAAHHFGFADLISPFVMAWFLVYLVMAILMYGSLFIAVGAACSDIRDTQTMLWPVMLIAMLPLFIWLNVAREPTSTFATVMSLVPTATPMLMVIRLAVPPGIAWWQPALGMLLMLVTTILFVYAAGRIFRVGILMQGKGASLRDLTRWMVRG
jgi:ABC-2 type transport system permease protein